jgi:hypothetical protein
LILLGACLLLLAGCGSGAVEAPPVSPEEAASQALAEYDTNKDGFLDARELDRCPALKGALSRIDKNKDGKLSADEIAERLADLQASKVGLVAVPCSVQLNEMPLAGATVTFIPEKFMGAAAKPATGVSDAQGVVQLQVEGQPVPGVHPGYYRIEVSKKNDGGQETLPARYNSATTLGHEVAPPVRINPTVALRLSS